MECWSLARLPHSRLPKTLKRYFSEVIDETKRQRLIDYGKKYSVHLSPYLPKEE